jgi:hypothetical protein
MSNPEEVRRSGAIYRTVTITRTLERPEKCSSPFESITCEMICTDLPTQEKPFSWKTNQVLDEMGDTVELTSHELLLAQCLASSGVDEAGY